MENLPIYLYNYKFNITLDLDSNVKGVNQVMYQRDLKVQKGVKNNIRVQFKNSDQKNIHISNTQTFVFSMFDAINKRLLLEKEIVILDENTTSTRGLGLLTLTESDTVDLDRTSYQYSIKMKDTDGSYVPAYSNTYYGIAGTLHLYHDIMPVLKDSVAIRDFQKHWNDSVQLYEQSSGDIYANPEYKRTNHALHTAAFYLNKYRGTIFVEGTLDNNPGVNANYSILEQRIYGSPVETYSGVDYVNFSGVYSYVRFRHVPAKSPTDPDNDNPDYYGSLSQILYRS